MRAACSAAVTALALAAFPAGFASQSSPATVTDVAGIRFVSDPLLNLHHVLYAAAWARRPDHARSLSDDLPGPLSASMSETDQRTWTGALDYYDKNLVTHDLLRDGRMVALQAALVTGDLGNPAVPPGLADVLTSAMPVYRQYYWSAHDLANRAWINDTAPRVQQIAGLVVPRLESLYHAKWFTSSIRADVVWVANREGAYTTLLEPPHVTIEPAERDWTAVEIVFHECSHVLGVSVQDQIVRALGDKARGNGALPHAILFYITGAVVQGALEERGIRYTPASVAMMSRVWPQYRASVESNWGPYVHGTRSLEEAIAGTVASLK